jgi:hypothetical protein
MRETTQKLQLGAFCKSFKEGFAAEFFSLSSDVFCGYVSVPAETGGDTRSCLASSVMSSFRTY